MSRINRQFQDSRNRNTNLRRPRSAFGDAGTGRRLSRRRLAAIGTTAHRRDGIERSGSGVIGRHGIPSGVRNVKTHTGAKSHLHFLPSAPHF